MNPRGALVEDCIYWSSVNGARLWSAFKLQLLEIDKLQVIAHFFLVPKIGDVAKFWFLAERVLVVELFLRATFSRFRVTLGQLNLNVFGIGLFKGVFTLFLSI